MMDFPIPLFESHIHRKAMCLVCADDFATMVLRGGSNEIVPICKTCSHDWNWYGYAILRRIKPGRLASRTLLFKLKHLFQRPSLYQIWKDIKGLQAWSKKMKKWMRD